MEASHSHETEGFIDTCACEGGAGVFAFIYVILAISFLLSIVIFG